MYAFTAVLDISNNNLSILDDNLPSSLCALIVSHNKLLFDASTMYPGNLNTLVISDNICKGNGDSLGNLPKSLIKLSATKVELRRIPATISRLSSIKELRLAHNKISKISVSLPSSLQILDLSHNLISDQK